MARSAANLRVAPTTSGQHTSVDFELRKERIQSAFVSIEESTAPIGNASAEAIVTALNSSPAPRRGVRWALPPSPNRLVGFVTERRWQGQILTVDADGKFWARVYDMSEENSDDVEEAQFDAEDVPDLMKDLVKPGGIFFWDIGYQVEPSGQRVRQSVLSFPMMPRVTAKEQQAARERALTRFSSLGWDQPRAPQASAPLPQGVLSEILASLKAAALAQPPGARPSQRLLGAILAAFKAATGKQAPTPPSQTPLDAIADRLMAVVAKESPAPTPQSVLAAILEEAATGKRAPTRPAQTSLDAITNWFKAAVAKESPAPTPQSVLAAILEEAATAKEDPLVTLQRESSLAARKELAEELGYTGDPGDFAHMNAWMRQQLQARLSAKLPPEMKH
jgi:hypothetical protein